MPETEDELLEELLARSYAKYYLGSVHEEEWQEWLKDGYARIHSRVQELIKELES